jgi:hypothetical protein
MCFVRRRRCNVPATVATLVAVLTVGVLSWVSSLAVATTNPRPPVLLVPGKSIGPVYLGEPETSVHLGRVVRNGPGSFAYPDYSLGVAYKAGKAIAISTNILYNAHGQGGAVVVSGQYETRSHPVLSIGVAIGLVKSAYPQAQCAHHIISSEPPLESGACLLRSNHGHTHTFFAGNATTQGQRVRIGAILVTIASVGPQSPQVTG